MSEQKEQGGNHMASELRTPPHSTLIMWMGCGEPHCTEGRGGVCVCVKAKQYSVNGKVYFVYFKTVEMQIRGFPFGFQDPDI